MHTIKLAIYNAVHASTCVSELKSLFFKSITYAAFSNRNVALGLVIGTLLTTTDVFFAINVDSSL